MKYKDNHLSYINTFLNTENACIIIFNFKKIEVTEF